MDRSPIDQARTTAGRPPRSAGARAAFEVLERRTLLAGSPFPLLTELEDSRNTVVRIEVKIGGEVKDIDLELFDVAGPDGASAAPNTVANFLSYLRSGRFDETFFHRLAFSGAAPFVLQGGGYRYQTFGDLEEVTTDAAIANEFDPARSNTIRRLAMARLGGQPDSATNQFYINLRNNGGVDATNPDTLDEIDGGFTVFGEVANNESWDVVQEIVALGGAQGSLTRDFDFEFLGGDTGIFDDVPVSSDFVPGVPVDPDQLMVVVDIEIIKPANTDDFFLFELDFPGGYRSPTITNSVDIVNLDSIGPALYQLIVRYERGQRDEVIATGSLAASEYRRLRVSDFADAALDLVRPGEPFSITLQGTARLAATYSHRDYGASVAETFLDRSTVTDLQAGTWDFGGLGLIDTTPLPPGSLRRSYVLYQNLSERELSVTVNFREPDGNLIQLVRILGPYRRGGLEIYSIPGLEDGATSIQVFATGPIVASVSVFQVRTFFTLPPPSGPISNAFAALGTPGRGSTSGALAGLRYGAAGESLLTAINTESTAAVITLFFHRTGGASIQRSLVLSPGTRGQFDLADSGVPEDETFSMTYTSGSTPVSMTYVSGFGDDAMATPVMSRGATTVAFAGGSYDPADPESREIISIFNPHADPVHDLQLVIRFHFGIAVGTVIELPLSPPIQLSEQGRLDIDVSTLTDVVAKIQSDPLFSTYAISISAIGLPVGTFDARIVAQITRSSGTAGSAVSSIFGPAEGVLGLADPLFGPGGSGI